MSGRRALAIGLLAGGTAVMTISLFMLRSPATAPIFAQGRVAHDRAGHNPREILVAGIGVALFLSGGILLVSRRG